MALFLDRGWCPAKVVEDNGDGTFTVMWHDGVKADRVKCAADMKHRLVEDGGSPRQWVVSLMNGVCKYNIM